MKLEHNQIKRDLQFILQSPFLFYDKSQQDSFVSQTSFAELKLNFSDDDLDLLSRNLSKSYQFNRLGHYFEALVFELIDFAEETDLLLKNRQIRIKKKTLGEIDLLFHHLESDRLFHWELAVKYYLSIHPKNDLEHFLGPNATDRFDRKIDLMQNKQLQLIDALNYDKAIQSQVFMKGYLFYDFGQYPDPLTLHKHIPNTHDKGWYIKASQFEKLNLQEDHFIMLNKKEWLSPFLTTDESRVMTGKQLKHFSNSYFRHYKHAILVVEVKYIENHWREQSRGFILPEEWPHEN